MHRSTLIKSMMVPCAIAIGLPVGAQAKVQHQPIVITKPVDKSSSKQLMKQKQPQPPKLPPSPPGGPVPVSYPNAK